MKAQNTRVLPFGDEAVAEAARLIRSGEPVAVPTETVYGLAADATDESAVARIYAAKGRPSFNPLIVHVESLAEAERLGIFSAPARALADAFWPGALTLVVPLRSDSGLAAAVTAGLGTVALRCPGHPAIRRLLAESARPLAAPSANASGGISPTRAEHVLSSLAGRIPLILDGGPTQRGLESTIVALEDGRARLLRPGPISLEVVEAILSSGPEGGDEQDRPAPGAASAYAGTSMPAHRLPSGTERIEAPGQLASHYAPAKPLRLDSGSAEPDEWLIGFGAVDGDDNLSPSGNLEEAASRLFDALHRADGRPRARIAVAPVPSEGIGLAINDRLRRAAAPKGED